MAFVCYRPPGSCNVCEHFRFSKEQGKNVCFGVTEASQKECYYNFLEWLKRKNIINMYGASEYLMKEFPLQYEEAVNVLCDWMDNYSKLSEQYGWDTN